MGMSASPPSSPHNPRADSDVESNVTSSSSTLGGLESGRESAVPASIWAVICPLALLSIHQLFILDRWHHHPYALICMHLAIPLTLRLLQWANKREESVPRQRAPFALSNKPLGGPISLARALAIIFQAVAMPLLFKALSVTSNIIVLVMVAFIFAQALRQASVINLSSATRLVNSLVPLLVAAVAIFVLSLAFVHGDQSGLMYISASVFCSAVADVLGSTDDSESDDERFKMHTASLILAAVISALLATHRLKDRQLATEVSGVNALALTQSAVCFTLALELGGSFINFRVHREVRQINGDAFLAWSWHPVVQVVMVSVAAALSRSMNVPGNLTWYHLATFLFGVVGLFVAAGGRFDEVLPWLSRKSRGIVRSGEHVYLEVKNSPSDTPPSPGRFTDDSPFFARFSALARAIGPSLFVLVAWSFAFLKPSPPYEWGYPAHNSPANPSLDLAYKAPAPFDVVVSHYQEPLDWINDMMAMLKSVPEIANLSPRLIVYTKDENAVPWEIKNKTGAFHVEKLDNEGREGGTYLHHIDTNWDSLSGHTFFTQAGVWDAAKLRAQMTNTFSLDIGMLGLGFEGNVVGQCDNPADFNGWKELPHVVQDVYNSVYKDDECQPHLLSFKGQFIASARRLRGIDRAVFTDLHQSLLDPQSWMHSGEYPEFHNKVDGTIDSLNAPHFGFTLERMWCTLMQCQDLTLNFKCPVQKFGTPHLVGDCLCWDDRRVSVGADDVCEWTRTMNFVD